LNRWVLVERLGKQKEEKARISLVKSTDEVNGLLSPNFTAAQWNCSFLLQSKPSRLSRLAADDRRHFVGARCPLPAAGET
jgi:hypothetical protein